MFKRIVFSACLAGLLAGLVLTAVQMVQVVPIILEAETYEASQPTAGHGDDTDHHHDSEAWAPGDGWQRTLFTAFANVLVAIGFALLLAAAFSLRPSFRWQHGLVWGLAGYLVFFVLPSLGLHPEIPGTVAAELSHRQAWWLLTVACSGAGLALLILPRQWLWKGSGILLLVIPHVIGAPHPEIAGSTAPQELADAFLIATLIANGIFWVLLGGLTGFMYQKLA